MKCICFCQEILNREFGQIGLTKNAPLEISNHELLHKNQDYCPKDCPEKVPLTIKSLFEFREIKQSDQVSIKAWKYYLENEAYQWVFIGKNLGGISVIPSPIWVSNHVGLMRPIEVIIGSIQIILPCESKLVIFHIK